MATIAGEHITTFDGKLVQFLGSCSSYVLSRDVMDSTFTLLKNYNTNTVTMATDNKQVEVSFNGQVRVDGDVTEMPYEFGNTQITRDGDLVKVSNARGFSLECDLVNEMCSLRMSGWYHGKVAGLMGTYSNEHVDDFTMSNGRTTDDVAELAQSWETSGTAQIFHQSQSHELVGCFAFVDCDCTADTPVDVFVYVFCCYRQLPVAQQPGDRQPRQRRRRSAPDVRRSLHVTHVTAEELLQGGRPATVPARMPAGGS